MAGWILPSRDRYRHVVERIAKNSPLSEGEIARKAIQLALDGAARKGSDDREAHVGFYLIDKGLPELERTAKMRRSMSGAFKRMASRFPLPIYLGAITLIIGGYCRRLIGEGACRRVA